MSMSPCGRSAGSPPPSPARSSSASPPRGCGRLGRLSPFLAAGLVTGCSLVSSPGSASVASFAVDSGAMFRRDTNRGGAVRAAPIRARTYFDRPGPSVILLQSTISSASPWAVPPDASRSPSSALPPVAASRASARATFIGCG
eukprot:4956816-Pleurochrysis_carterae.AAC.1